MSENPTGQENMSEEIVNLRRCMRSLVALSTLPAIWTGREPDEIAKSLAEALFSMLRLEIAYVRLVISPSQEVIEVVCVDQNPRFGKQAQEIGKLFQPWLESTRSNIARSIPNPIGNGELQLAIAPIRQVEEYGFIAVCSKQKDFPSEIDRLLLSVGANQAATSLQGIKLITALREADKLHEKLLSTEQEARKMAESANRIKDEFLATVSHELRTPLTSMLGWVRLLRSGNLDETNAAKALETIERNVKNQAHLVEDLLDIARITSGKMRLNVCSLDPSTAIHAAVDAVRPAAEAKNIRIQTILDSNAGPVLGDYERLQQVVWNLLSNSIKFTPKGGRISIQLERVESHIEITVKDTGKGIGYEFLPYIFNPFTQADGSINRSFGGLGMGLAIVKHIVELHGGTTVVSSEGEGHGATFTIKLPLLVVRKEFNKGERVHPQVSEGLQFDLPYSLNGLRILVVDDEPDTREILKIILQQSGAEVRTANSASQAINILDQWLASLLICDIGMPGETGYDLIQKVRARDPKKGGKIPAIALTAFARIEDRIKALKTGFQMHVPKPIEPAELITIVANLTGVFGNSVE
jgi:signal transduction histidine kinase/CheY-like chemotaxis protein